MQQITFNRSTLGKRVREYRNRANITQNELAEKAQIDNNNLSRIERGETTPTLETVLKIANALNITPNDILLENYDCPNILLDNEISKLLDGLSPNDRLKIIEYIRFIKQK